MLALLASVKMWSLSCLWWLMVLFPVCVFMLKICWVTGWIYFFFTFHCFVAPLFDGIFLLYLCYISCGIYCWYFSHSDPTGMTAGFTSSRWSRRKKGPGPRMKLCVLFLNGGPLIRYRSLHLDPRCLIVSARFQIFAEKLWRSPEQRSVAFSLLTTTFHQQLKQIYRNHNNDSRAAREDS